MTDYTFSNADYTLSVQAPSHDGELLTAILYDFKWGAEPTSLSLTHDQLIGLDTLNNDSMAIGYALALVDFASDCLAL